MAATANWNHAHADYTHGSAVARAAAAGTERARADAPYSPHQRGFFVSEMDRDEAWLFKNFDSESAGAAQLAPYGAPSNGTVAANLRASSTSQSRNAMTFSICSTFGGQTK